LRRANVPLALAEIRTFHRLVKRGFSQRRKMMFKLLKVEWPVLKLDAAYAELGLSPEARAETVSLEQFVQLAKLLAAPDKTYG
jgi:16S rRNA (adenine1518-N6/adenine1519-N6)-dimethyltransferase